MSRGEDIAAVDVADPVVDDELALDDSSSMPVTSTFCPTCGDNFESSASSRYCERPAIARDGLDDEVAVELELLPGAPLLVLEFAELEAIVAFIKR